MSRGHIKKRGDTYSIVISLGTDSTTGKRKRQWVAVKGNKKDAEKRLAELLHQLDSGSYIKPSKTTLREYLDTWLKEYAQPNLSPRTTEGYAHIFHKYLIPALGNLTLTQIKPEHLQRYYSDRLNGGLSAQTVRHHHTVLHKALQTALKWGLLNRNVVDGVEAPKAKRTEMQSWDEEEITRFLETARKSSHYALFYTALYTGMRRSELLGLRWSDVDLLLGQISVSRALHHLRDGTDVFTQPKSAKSRRTIALPPSAILTLKKHWEKQVAEHAIIGSTLRSEELVFSGLEGEPLRPDSVTHAWIKLVRRAGIKFIRFHDARHTHASIMLKSGVHPKIVQERLGHSTIAITLDTYSHVAPGLQEMAALRFDEALTSYYNERENEAVETVG